MIRNIIRFFFWLLGWKITGSIPNIKQYVIITAPHTSTWDFIVLAATKLILKLDIKYVAKKSLFNKSYGWFFKMLGGIPVDRSQRTNFVTAAADLFSQHETFSLAFAPEGTRSYIPEWKTGFYYVAKAANVPIVMAGADYLRKIVSLSEPYYLTGEIKIDFEFMRERYKECIARHPNKTFLNNNSETLQQLKKD